MDFYNKTAWKNSSKIVLSKVLPTSHCRNYALRFHWHMHIFIELSKNLKRVRGLIVFSISQVA